MSGTAPFRIYLTANAASALGDALAAIALAFAVLDVGGGPAAVGVVLAATRLPLAALVLLGGVAGDRLATRTILVAADGARACAQAAVAVALLAGRASLALLAGAALVAGTCQAFAGPAGTAGLASLVAPASLQRANATLAGARSTCGIVGMLAGGALVAALGAGSAFAVDAASFAVSAVLLATLRLSPARPARASVLRELAAGWRSFASRPWLVLGVVHVSLFNALAFSPFLVLGPVQAERVLGGARDWGLVGAGFAAGLVVGSAVAARWRAGRPLLVAFAGMVLAAPQLVLLAVGAPAAVVALGAGLGGAQAAYWTATWTTSLQRAIPQDVLARVSAYASVGSLVLVPLALPIVGAAAGRAGLAPVLLAAAAWVVASTAVVVVAAPIRTFVDPPLQA